MASTYTSKFSYGDLVYIDGDVSIIGTATAFCFRDGYDTIEVSWITNGDAKVRWFEHWRLTLKE